MVAGVGIAASLPGLSHRPLSDVPDLRCCLFA